jgi:hypothetical protein
MKTLKLDIATRRYLTAESLVDKAPVGVMCDLKGKPLGASALPFAVYTEIGTGKAWVKIANILPSNSDPTSVAQREAIVALTPEFCDSDNGDARGYYIPAPDFTLAPVAA